jgi:hypothetical protein
VEGSSGSGGSSQVTSRRESARPSRTNSRCASPSPSRVSPPRSAASGEGTGAEGVAEVSPGTHQATLQATVSRGGMKLGSGQGMLIGILLS